LAKAKEATTTKQAETRLPKFLRRVEQYICAGYQNLCIDTTELDRIQTEIESLCEHNRVQAVLTWDCIEGLVVRELNEKDPEVAKITQYRVGDKITARPPGDSKASQSAPPIPLTDPLMLLEFLQNPEKLPYSNCIVVLRNFHVFMKAVATAQSWQNAVVGRKFNCVYNKQDTSGSKKTISTTRVCFPIILGSIVDIPKSLASTVTKLEYELPDLDYMRALVSEQQKLLIQSYEIDKSSEFMEKPKDIPPELHERISRLLRGLNSVEAADALTLSSVQNGTLATPDVLDTIEYEKAKIIEISGALRYVRRNQIPSVDAIGGWDNFKKWIKRIRHCYSLKASQLKLDPAKGVVLLGVPGTGKSLVGKISARLLGDIPLIMMDVGAIFGSYVGESERKMGEAIRTIEAMENVVVMVDEADKLWGGAADSSGDSGVTRRVFGRFLTWLAEKKDNSFVIMTMNKMDALPPELMRKGRFDEIFYTDLPSADERRVIMEIHLRSRGINPDNIFTNGSLWDAFNETVDGFVGAELEEVVKQARLTALDSRDDGTPTYDELMGEAKAIHPMVETDSAAIDKIREVCKDVGRAVSSAPPINPRRAGNLNVGGKTSRRTTVRGKASE